MLHLAADTATLAGALDKLAAAGVFPRHLATARSGTLQTAGQLEVRSPLQFKYELVAQLGEEVMHSLLDSYTGVLSASVAACTAGEDDGLSESRTSSSGGWVGGGDV